MDKPTYQVAETSSADGTLHVTGKGWCTAGKDSAWVIGVKIDEGKISRLNDNLHTNRTIWEIIRPDPKTGDFDINMVLPDGTTSEPRGSQPALGMGAHTLRFLTGTLQTGDPTGSVPPKTRQDTTFVIGNYAPNGVPDPINVQDDLTGEPGLTVEDTGSDLVVTNPGAEEGHWAYFNAYTADGSERPVWGTTWYQADAQGRYTIPKKSALPSGPVVITAQDGSRGNVGKLLGWGRITLTDESSDTDGASGIISALGDFESQVKSLDKAVTSAKAAVSTTATMTAASATSTTGAKRTTTLYRSPAAAATQAKAAEPVAAGSGKTASSAGSSTGAAGASTSSNAPGKPDFTPSAPVDSADKLTNSNTGGVKGTLSGGVLTLTVPKADANSWAFVHVYSPDPKELGWVQLNAEKQIAVDVSALGEGVHKFSMTSASKQLIGWSGVDFGTASEAEEANVLPTAYEAQSASVMRGGDWALIVMSLALVAVGGLGTYAWKRTRNL
ncbi:hypothetical protein [Corynebacterium auris]|uniref:hypothetical protein n=1 Tax=Corynebacterium auris TaxID=44750 RepID=UPI0025B4F27A|nr:hypothetical protein [Corynebacterium auris]